MDLSQPSLFLPLIFSIPFCSKPWMAPQNEFHLLVLTFRTLHTLTSSTFSLSPRFSPTAPQLISFHIFTCFIRKRPLGSESADVYSRPHFAACWPSTHCFLSLGLGSLSEASGLGEMSQGLLRLKVFPQNLMPSQVVKNSFSFSSLSPHTHTQTHRFLNTHMQTLIQVHTPACTWACVFTRTHPHIHEYM